MSFGMRKGPACILQDGSHRFIQWHNGAFSRMYPLLSMLSSCQSGFVFSSSRFGWKVQKCPWLTLDEEEVRTSQFSAQTQIGIRKRFETILLPCLNFVPGKVGASHSSAEGTAWNEANVSEIGGWMLFNWGQPLLCQYKRSCNSLLRLSHWLFQCSILTPCITLVDSG